MKSIQLFPSLAFHPNSYEEHCVSLKKGQPTCFSSWRKIFVCFNCNSKVPFVNFSRHIVTCFGKGGFTITRVNSFISSLSSAEIKFDTHNLPRYTAIQCVSVIVIVLSRIGEDTFEKYQEI